MIDVAIVGGGLMGTLHARNLASLEGVRVRSVHDADPERAARLADELGAAVAAELEAALDDVDAVAIAVPPFLNRAVAEAALAAGKHVFLEKPLATTAEDADAILAAAARAEGFLMVGHVLRFWPGYVEIARRVAAEELGPPVAVTAWRLQRPPDWSPWILDPERSGGIMPLVLVHDFDQLNRLLGRPLRVLARPLAGAGRGAVHVVALVDHERGRGVVEAGVAMPPSFPFSSGIRVVCQGGGYEYALEVPQARDDDADAGRFTPTEPPTLKVFTQERVELVPLGDTDVWLPELEHFVDCVAHGTPPSQGTPAQAREALAVALAANRSLESGAAEPV